MAVILWSMYSESYIVTDIRDIFLFGDLFFKKGETIVSDFFNWDNKFMTAMSKASDAILLGILWIACCLPIVTVGASSAAFYYAYHKAVRQRRGYAWKEFFQRL